MPSRVEKELKQEKSLKSSLLTKVPSTEGACSGGCWSLLNDVAIDSACVIDYVTKTGDFVSNNDVGGGVMLLTSSGDISKADGRGDTSFQSLARHVDTGELLIHKYETGNGGTTHVQNSKQDLLISSLQDLLSSSFLSRHGMVPVQDHENPRVIIRSRPGFEITCYEVNNLWFMPLCVWGKGCDNCHKCQAVERLTCWDEDGNLMKFVHTDNVRFGTLPAPEPRVAALHTNKVKSLAADERRADSSRSRDAASSTQNMSHVMALQGISSPKETRRADSSRSRDAANIGDKVAGGWRVFYTITREVRASSHAWFQEDMSSRRDALTNFDMDLFPNLRRLANGKSKVLMTKEERQALKLREPYCDPKNWHES